MTPQVVPSTPGRAGRCITQPTGYRAFIPAALPPDPPSRLEWTLQSALAEAGLALGRLDGSVLTLPHPDLFVFMYVRKEAVLSSQIEGTQSSLTAPHSPPSGGQRSVRMVDFSTRVTTVGATENC